MTPDGYPDEEELTRIRTWHWDDGWKALMEYVRERWWMADVLWRQSDDDPAVAAAPDEAYMTKRGARYYSISTGGWSGNESLIEAMRDNEHLFWTLGWWSSRRGGHYTFVVTDITR